MKIRRITYAIALSLFTLLLFQNVTIPISANSGSLDDLMADDAEMIPEDNQVIIDGEIYGLGALEETVEPTYVPPAARTRAVLPSSVDLSEDMYFPPIDSQGHINSCAAWASTYYQFTYEMARLKGWNAKENAEYRASPKWSYNYANGDENGGTYISRTMWVLETSGAAKWTEFPYSGDETNPLNYLEWCTDIDVIREAAKIRASKSAYESYATGDVDTPITSCNDEDLTNIKTYLSSGHPLSFSTDFFNWITVKTDSYGYVVIGQLSRDGSRNGHALTIVGYDDSISYDINQSGTIEDFEKGAFKVANSHGTKYRNDGFVWIMYDTLNRVSNAENMNYEDLDGYTRKEIIESYAFHSMEVDEYSTSNRAEVTLNSVKRRDPKLVYGVYPLSTQYAPLQFPGSVNRPGPLGFDATQNAVDCTFLVDFGSAPEDQWRLSIRDSKANAYPTIVKKITYYKDDKPIQTLTPNWTLDGESESLFYTDDATVVFSYDELRLALADNSIDSIRIGNNIRFTGTLSIDRSVSIKPNNQDSVTLYAANGVRHFSIKGTDVNIDLTGTVLSGGGILNSGSLTLTGGIISDNISADRGGGIYNTGTLVLEDIQVSNNSSKTHGGGIYNTGSLIIKSGNISGNTAAHSGGGIYSSNELTIEQGEISGNAARYGGGLYTAHALTIGGGRIINNSASDNGGGIKCGGGTALIGSVKINDNYSRAGAGIYTNFTVDMTIESGEISGNSAVTGGGAIYSCGTSTIRGGSIINNYATHSGSGGGGIKNYSTGSLTIQSGEISGNSAGSGGGIENQGSLVIRGGKIINNSAVSCGGGIYNPNLKTSIMTIEDGEITGNSAKTGSGLYNCASSTVIIVGGILDN